MKWPKKSNFNSPSIISNNKLNKLNKLNSNYDKLSTGSLVMMNHEKFRIWNFKTILQYIKLDKVKGLFLLSKEPLLYKYFMHYL